MSFGKKIAILVIATIIILALLFILLFNSIKQDVMEGENVGLFPPANTPTPTVSSEERRAQRQEKEENKEVIPTEVEGDLPETISTYISNGQFVDLDNWLWGLENAYKDNPNVQDQTKMAMIDTYRADIAYYNGIQSTTAPTWGFQNPEMTAAAYVYGSIESKYLAVIDEMSGIFPKVTGEINLHQSSKAPAEIRAELTAINQRRSADGQFNFLQIWDLTIQDMECEMLVVANRDYLWHPYSLRAKDGHEFGLTVEDCRDMKRENASLDLDSAIQS